MKQPGAITYDRVIDILIEKGYLAHRYTMTATEFHPAILAALTAAPSASGNTDVCLRCGRAPSDLIHDNPNDHGWTGTGAMHPFVNERGKWLLQQTAKNVFLRGKSGQKGRRLSEDQVRWNAAIGKAENAVAEMFAPLTEEALAEHDRYFANEYAERASADAERAATSDDGANKSPREIPRPRFTADLDDESADDGAANERKTI